MIFFLYTKRDYLASSDAESGLRDHSIVPIKFTSQSLKRNIYYEPT